MLASQNLDWTVVKVLVAHRANVNVVNESGHSILMLAARFSDVDMIAALLARGSHIGARDKKGWTALLYAIVSGKPANVRVLLDVGADVNARANDNRTPMMEVKKLLSPRHALDSEDKANLIAIVHLLKQHGTRE